MTRTRLRGVSIGGIEIGIEVPEAYDWEWPDAPVSEFQCLPREPEVHVGLRVADPGRGDLGGERYGVGAWTFEVARAGSDWLLGLSRRGERQQLAHFDSEFRVGEIIASPSVAETKRYPLQGPLDEWIVLHRTIARGGLCLNASAVLEDGASVLRLGAAAGHRPHRWHRPSSSLLGRSALLVRPGREGLRAFRSPWCDSIDSGLAFESKVSRIERIEGAQFPWTERLDVNDAADLLFAHAIVPFSDEGLLEQVLCNAQQIARDARVEEIGDVASAAVSPVSIPMEWCSVALRNAFAPAGAV